MSRLRGLLRPIRTLFRKEAVDRDRNAEMLFHLEMQTEQFVREGMSPEDARRAARVAFGGAERYREERRQASWVHVLEDLMADVRYAARSLRRRPGFAVAVALTLGLGVGGTTAIFSVVDGLFLRAPAGVEDADRVRRIYIARDEGSLRTGPGGGPGSYLDYVALRDHLGTAEHVATFLNPTLVDHGLGVEAEQIRVGVVSRNYFRTLGVRPHAGRFFLAEEDEQEGLNPVSVVSHSFAESRLGGADAAIGAVLLLNGQNVPVIGVAARAFTGLDATATDVWVTTASAAPMGLAFSGWRTNEGMIALGYVARLAPAAEAAALEEEATTLLRHLAEQYPGLDPTPLAHTNSVVPAAGPNRSPAADLSLWLGVVAVLVLVIACANVSNLLLARGMTRRREMGVRLSLGATRGRVARQQLAESLGLAGLGAVAGILVTFAGLVLVRQFPLPLSAGQLDGRLLLFAVVVALLTGVIFGLVPALRAGRLDTMRALRENRLNPGVGGARARRALVALQVALSVVLLVGAGLFVRSLRQVYAIDPGLELGRVLTVEVDLAQAGYSADEREQFYRDARNRLDALPDVERTAMVHFPPFGGMAYSIGWDLPGAEDPGFDEGPYRNLAGSGFFRTIGTQVLDGREFVLADARGEPAAVINERMARAVAPAGRAVNLCVALGAQVEEGGCTRIVGVVENYRHRYLREADVPMVFLPRERDPAAISWGGPALMVRTRGDAADAVATVRSAVQELRPALPYVAVEPLEEAVRADVLPYRLGATLFTLFGALALILAAVGLYGVLSYFVTERTPEIGIRRSLGAPAGRVVRLVVGQGFIPVTGGLAVGLAAAWGGTRFITSLLFGVQAQDPLAFIAAVAFLMGVAGLAMLAPARRAARVDPMIALRED